MSLPWYTLDTYIRGNKTHFTKKKNVIFEYYDGSVCWTKPNGEEIDTFADNYCLTRWYLTMNL